MRTYWGTCDPLDPPRPFTPVVDIADRVGGDLRRALADGDRDAVHEAFLALLRRPGAPPSIVVLDDMHWADEATLDLFRVVARRVTRLPTLLIGTFRDDEVEPITRCGWRSATCPPPRSSSSRCPPLSVAAVGRLAGGRADAPALHAATAGNAFFVTEVLAAGGSGVPATVRDAVLRRVERLSPAGRRVIRAAAVLGPGSEVREVLAVADEPPGALAECTSRGLLHVSDEVVAFRHELGRQAVLDSMGSADQAALHSTALHVLRARYDTDLARLARHAIAAGDRTAVLELAPIAGRTAAKLGANREAAAFYRAAIVHADGLQPRRHADLLERLAEACSLSDDIPQALDAQRTAIRIWRTLGDRRAEGASLTELSLLLWLDGASDEAMRAAVEGADLLAEVAPGSPELARAWAVLAQRQLVEGRDYGVMETSSRAFELAERLGETRTSVHALTTMAVGRIFLGDEEGWSMLEDAVARGRAARLPEETARALINLVEAARDLRRYGWPTAISARRPPISRTTRSGSTTTCCAPGSRRWSSRPGGGRTPWTTRPIS